MRSVGLFAGIGGFELGLQRAGIEPELLSEYWEPAASTLRRRFRAEVVGDIREIEAIPRVDLLTGGFPCTDFSQAGRTRGLDGEESSLVWEALRLIEANPPTWVVLENVPNMLSLAGGRAMREITSWFGDRGWAWAYRTVDSQHFGVRQRRRRVFFVASQSEDPRAVLFADDAGIITARDGHAAYGFSWTEGNRGLGWGPGVTPTLKGGSKLGIASPPGVWRPGAGVGATIVRPSIESGERLQGFHAGWTSHVSKTGERWKLVGNAVSVPVATWVAKRIVSPGTPMETPRRPLEAGAKWPMAAAGGTLPAEAWDVSERPIAMRPFMSLDALLRKHGAEPLSLGATSGFTKRLKASSLKYRDEFVADLDLHIGYMSAV